MNKNTLSAFSNYLAQNSERTLEKQKCLTYVLAKYFNQLRTDTQLLISGFIPEIGIPHSQILQRLTVADDPSKPKLSAGIENDIAQKASKAAINAQLQEFFRY